MDQEVRREGVKEENDPENLAPQQIVEPQASEGAAPVGSSTSSSVGPDAITTPAPSGEPTPGTGPALAGPPPGAAPPSAGPPPSTAPPSAGPPPATAPPSAGAPLGTAAPSPGPPPAAAPPSASVTVEGSGQEAVKSTGSADLGSVWGDPVPVPKRVSKPMPPAPRGTAFYWFCRQYGIDAGAQYVLQQRHPEAQQREILMFLAEDALRRLPTEIQQRVMGRGPLMSPDPSQELLARIQEATGRTKASRSAGTSAGIGTRTSARTRN